MNAVAGRRVLVTGASGFLGRHLVGAFAAAGAEVTGLTRNPSPTVEGERRRLLGTILDGRFLSAALGDERPDVIVHTAGAVDAADGARHLFELNVVGTDRLLRAVARTSAARQSQPLVIVASSGAVYGSPLRHPIDEDSPFAPVSAYAASKAAQEMVACQYQLDGGPTVVRARFFNLAGPNQKPSLVLSHLASGVVAAEQGGSPVIPVGNVRARRDFVDVRDAVRAVVLLAATPGAHGPFNIATGRSRSIEECALLLASHARCPVEFKIDPARQRAVEIADQVGSAARLRALTGWEPVIPFDQTVRDMLDDWRAR